MIITTDAKIDDIEGVVKLLNKFHVNSIEPSDKKDGFVTTMITREQLVRLIEHENGLTVAKHNDEVIGFVMAASWHFWEEWPFFKHMIGLLHKYEIDRDVLSKDNSYQYGPICIDKQWRGTDVLNLLFSHSLHNMGKRFKYLVTFVNKINGRSHKAHRDKLMLTTLDEFEFNNNYYYFMTCRTQNRNVNMRRD
ncbi:GNAT family acetyltransferase [Enterobacteriaceae bacterium RIT697]|uniref:GNAT family acetyltransferase n=1 Tax=Pantoea endophytica TaxID=92488 RepID=UPI0012AE32C1|nr:GNAT family acetyltransferase [Pantoea endophytica]MRT24955.1 GNAT family acetyltransferase [Enterobacteriaceae bacterium RIT697]